MRATAAPTTARDRPAPVLTTPQVVFDVLLAAACLGLVLAINLGGSESVSANRDTDALTVVLTVVAVGSIALRRRFPLGVLVVSLAAILGLVLVKGTVGVAPIALFVAAYTAVALGSPQRARAAMGVVVGGLVLTWLLDPVDLSQEGALLNVAAFAGVLLLATSSRARRERAAADLLAADHRTALERERADAERERAAFAAAEERLRITRELHDVIGHAMSVMVVQAGAAGRLLETSDPERARTAVGEIERTGRAAMAEMRTLLGVLRDGESEPDGSPRAPTPGLEDVHALVARVGEAGLPTTLEVHGAPVTLTTGVGLAAYRVVQEALTNCLKHSGATSASVDVTYRPTVLEVVVSDNGRGRVDGAPGPAAGPAAGHGLPGMRERVAAYGGELSAGDRPGGGFRVCARFPMAATP